MKTYGITFRELMEIMEHLEYDGAIKIMERPKVFMTTLGAESMDDTVKLPIKDEA